MKCGGQNLPGGYPDRVLITAFLALTLAVSAGLAQTTDSASPVLHAVTEAENALRQNEPQLAESRYRAALLEGWLLLGAIASAENDMETAKRAYEMALTCAAETVRARLSLAAVHVRTGNPAEAIILLRMIIAKARRNSSYSDQNLQSCLLVHDSTSPSSPPADPFPKPMS